MKLYLFRRIPVKNILIQFASGLGTLILFSQTLNALYP